MVSAGCARAIGVLPEVSVCMPYCAFLTGSERFRYLPLPSAPRMMDPERIMTMGVRLADTHGQGEVCIFFLLVP